MALVIIFLMDHVVPYGELPQTYVYEHPPAGDDGALEAHCIIILKRSLGFMAALPVGVLTAEEIAAGEVAGMDALIGPSVRVEVAAAMMSEEGLLPQPGVVVPCIVVDFGATAASRFSVLGETQEPEILISFDSATPDLLPEPSAVLQQALVWAQRPDTPQERVAFYSAEEGPPPPPRARLRLSKSDPPRAGAGATGSGASAPGPKQAAPKRVTTSSLASQLEAITAALPTLTAKLEEVASKQTAMEARISSGPNASLREPLGALGASPKGLPVAFVGPPPSHHKLLVPPAVPPVAANTEAAELLDEGEETGANPLAQAVLAQSRAMTALVSQLAASSNDPVLDLGTQGSVSTRGAAQRAKLQDELASGRGSFYAAVLANMARRMSPAASASTDPAILLSQGVSLTRYFERFGGFGQTKDLALIAFQVAMAMDAMQAGRIEQVQDHLALLAVSLEQASLDGGRMDLAYQLTWLEEPPSGMYANRASSGLMRTRPFAPLASQRWMTVVLGYLKEMEVIQTRRGDNARPRGSPSGSDPAAETDSPARPKKPPRKPKKEG